MKEPKAIFSITPNALLVNEHQPSIAPSYDFHRLPYADEEHDVFPNTPFLSETIASKPFDRPSHHLERGLHLHWLMPSFLRKSIALPMLKRDYFDAALPSKTEQERYELWHALASFDSGLIRRIDKHTLMVLKPLSTWESTPEIVKNHPILAARLSGQGANGRDFPAVPNRWEIVRLLNGTPQRRWTMESDFIHPAGFAPESPENYTTFPWLYSDGEGSNQPFRFIGRVLKDTDTPEDGSYLAHHPLSGPLTSLGFGDPSFSAFYPNCRSVFGFCDTEIVEGAQLDGLHYQITGRYSDPSLDYWSALLGYYDAEALTERFGFKWDTEPPQQLECHANVSMSMLASLSGSHLAKVNVTIANSGTEAISAALGQASVSDAEAEKTDWMEADDIESLVESILMDDRLAGKAVDLRLKFHEYRHEQEFYSVTGGFRWVFQSLPKDEQNDHEMKSLYDPAKLFDLLAKLNRCQQEYSRLQDELRSAQRQTFADWHLYLKCLHPGDGTLDHYPEPDELRGYIQAICLPKVKELKRKAGVLHLNQGPRGEIKDAMPAPDAASESKAVELTRLIRELIAALNNSGSELGLYRIPGPRFHLPKEPAVCLSGLPLMGMLHDQTKGAESSAQTFYQNAAEIPAVTLEPTGSWNPLFLDWQMDFFPVKGEKKPTWRGDRYTEDYIVSNFNLQANQTDLTLDEASSFVTNTAEQLEGRSILDPFPRQQVRNKLSTWRKEHLEATEGESPIIAELEKLKRAIEWLDSTPMLTQSLSGLNSAMTGHRWAWQLPVSDPHGFEAYRAFAEEVSAAVDLETLAAPMPFHDFHPIRAGEIAFSGLRLIDSFGQYRDLPINEVHGAKKMRSETPGHAHLPVRILQGTRLDFRWMQHEAHGLESQGSASTSPIAGWVLPEFLERQLALFDHNGVPIGTLAYKRWTPAQSPAGPASISDMPESSLKGFALYLKNYLDSEEGNLAQLLTAFHTGTEHSEPETGHDDDFVSMLFGRPLAIVHARLNLELQGHPITNGSWDETWRKLNSQQFAAASNGFTEVKIPVRIGEHHQLNDGVMCWWEWEGESENLRIKHWHLPQELAGENDQKKAEKHCLETFLSDQPRHLGLLVNPLGHVHLSSGVLPVKSVDLPAVHYQDAMSKMKGTLFTGPLITPKDELAIPLPNVVRHQWSWLGKNADRLAFKAPNLHELPDQLEIRDGWLQLEEQNNEPKTSETT